MNAIQERRHRTVRTDTSPAGNATNPDDFRITRRDRIGGILHERHIEPASMNWLLGTFKGGRHDRESDRGRFGHVGAKVS